MPLESSRDEMHAQKAIIRLRLRRWEKCAPSPATHHPPSMMVSPRHTVSPHHHCLAREFEKNHGRPADYEDKKDAKDFQKLCTRLREIEMDQERSHHHDAHMLHHTPQTLRQCRDAPPLPQLPPERPQPH